MVSECFHNLLNEQLLQLSLPKLTQKGRVLEIGAHKGRLSERLLPVLEEANLFTLDRQVFVNPFSKSQICADAECLPFKQQSFDWIVSGGTFQWFENQKKTLAELYKITKPGGVLSFSQFIEGSMEPLAGKMRLLELGDRILTLKSDVELKATIEESPWEDLAYHSLEGKDCFGSFSESLKFLREIGATRVQQHPAIPLRIWKELCRVMEATKSETGYPLHWKAKVVVLKKPL